MNVLGIETSCDETAVALVEDGQKVLASLVYSQTDLHAKYGGVVPEAASRDHLRKLPLLVKEALAEAGLRWADLDLVGVTQGPGLIGPLLVGVSYAMGLAWAQGIPLVGVNHLAAHLFAHRLAYPDLPPPFLGLIVSGGHTLLVLVPRWGEYRVLGGTRDDAAGEALDKFGRLVGLGYPAGPKIDELARQGNPQAVPFPRPMMEAGLEMSFAGLKTAAVYWLRDHSGTPLPDLCASYLEAVVEILAEKAIRAARRFQLPRIVVVGGVAANSRLREVLPERARPRNLEVHFPPAELCTDNAAVTACCAFFRHKERAKDELLTLVADPNLALDGWS